MLDLDKQSAAKLFGEATVPLNVRKHSDVIQISNSISFLQRKIYNVLLKHAYPDLATQRIHRMKMSKLKEMLEIDSYNYEYIEESVKSLMKTTVRWSIVDQSKDAFGITTLLAAVRYRGGVIEYEFAQMLVDKLYEPATYGIIDIKLQNQLTSKYSLALYENAVRFLAEGRSDVIALEDFYDLLGISRQLEFKYAKRDCINPALREINQTSDLRVEIEYHKRGKKVVGAQILVDINDGKYVGDPALLMEGLIGGGEG
ncbi:replication initiation protein [Chitinimonas lacunae]|uniref:Replication initiation protein n=1 Tax=Chitinimonas lacunae TaxID=1963018 RepID=A0ABV8MU62_9NEIS